LHELGEVGLPVRAPTTSAAVVIVEAVEAGRVGVEELLVGADVLGEVVGRGELERAVCDELELGPRESANGPFASEQDVLHVLKHWPGLALLLLGERGLMLAGRRMVLAASEGLSLGLGRRRRRGRRR
jgi:hypothetical protein